MGAIAVVRHLRRGLRFIDACLAFGAGFMLAVTVLGVMPQVLDGLLLRRSTYWLGYFAVHLAQHVFTTSFSFRRGDPRSERRRPAPPRCLDLTLHTFFDGVAIASGFLVSGRLGILLFLAVLLHKLPEGVTIASVMVAGGRAARGRLGRSHPRWRHDSGGAVDRAGHHAGAGTGWRSPPASPSTLRPRTWYRSFRPSEGWLTAAAFFGGAAGYFLTERLLAGWVQ